MLQYFFSSRHFKIRLQLFIINKIIQFVYVIIIFGSLVSSNTLACHMLFVYVIFIIK
jgi:hypothetical protein